MREALIGAIATIAAVFIANYLKNKDFKGVIGTLIVTVIAILIVMNIGKGEKEGESSSVITTFPPTTIDTSTDTIEETETIADKEKSLLGLSPYTMQGASSITNCPFAIEHNIKDIFGTVYLDAYRAYMERDEEGRSITFKLDKEYQKLTFSLGVSFESRGVSHTGALFVYVNGEKVVSEEVIPSDYPTTEFTVDLTDADYLKIEMYADGNMGYDGISILMLNPTLYR